MTKTMRFVCGLVLSYIIIINTIEVKCNNAGAEYCLANDTNPFVYFSTKTAYQYIHGDYFKLDEQIGHKQRITTIPDERQNDCQPLQYWSIVRHGTRLPSQKTIIAFQTILPILQKQIINNYYNAIKLTQTNNNSTTTLLLLCTKDIENLKQWQFDKNISIEYANYLTSQGENDMKYFGRRTAMFLPSLFYPRGDFNPDNYIFKYSKTERILKSYEAFIEGVFDNDAKKVHGTIIAENDTIIENYATCDTYLENKEYVESNPRSEPNQFLTSDIFEELIDNVTIKLGFNEQLNTTTILLMYDICRYEKAWHFNKPSPWCAVFTPNQLRILEYWQDLTEYYINGYGNKYLSAQLGCFAVQDMLQHFQQVVEAREIGRHDYPKVVTAFGHSAIINILLTTLGVAEDSFSIMANNFDTNQTNHRLWRTSKLTPFAANIGVILYECSNPNNTTNYSLESYLNEIPVHKYELKNASAWEWTDFYNKFQSTTNQCSLDICKNFNDIKVVQI